MRDVLGEQIHLRNGYGILTTIYAPTGKSYYNSKSSDNLLKGRVKNKSNGELSPGAIKNMTNSINNLIASSTPKKLYHKKSNKYYQFKISFITLTLSDNQQHTDKEITRLLLKPFIQWLRDSKSVVNYVWKAETQKNGRIHYHLLINKFIHYREIQKEWNKLQLKYGYLNKYYDQHQHYNAPSTEIKAVKKIKNISGYFIKYLVKNQKDRRLVNSKIWGSSYNLLKKCDPVIIQNKIGDEVRYIINNISDNFKHYEYFSYLQYSMEKFNQYKSELLNHWYNFISGIAEPEDQQLIFTI